MIVYDKEYFESSNYKDYTSGRYRVWHWVRFLMIGLWLKAQGYRSVLDFGCADGISVAAFRLLGIEAWGCDVSEYAISMAPAWIRKYVWVGDIGVKKFEPKHFELCVSWDVLEHIPAKRLEKTTVEIMRIAKKALFGIYVSDEMIARIHKLIGKQHPDHVSEHKLEWWISFFGDHGLKIKHLACSRKGTIWVEPV